MAISGNETISETKFCLGVMNNDNICDGVDAIN
jgi:hypothetical protein